MTCYPTEATCYMALQRSSPDCLAALVHESTPPSCRHCFCNTASQITFLDGPIRNRKPKSCSSRSEFSRVVSWTVACGLGFGGFEFRSASRQCLPSRSKLNQPGSYTHLRCDASELERHLPAVPAHVFAKENRKKDTAITRGQQSGMSIFRR